MAENARSPSLLQEPIGHVRAFDDGQLNQVQVGELGAAGRNHIHQELGSGVSRTRPVSACR